MASCQNTSKAPAIDMANFDLSVAPDADFYQYTTGGEILDFARMVQARVHEKFGIEIDTEVNIL